MFIGVSIVGLFWTKFWLLGVRLGIIYDRSRSKFDVEGSNNVEIPFLGVVDFYLFLPKLISF